MTACFFFDTLDVLVWEWGRLGTGVDDMRARAEQPPQGAIKTLTRELRRQSYFSDLGSKSFRPLKTLATLRRPKYVKLWSSIGQSKPITVVFLLEVTSRTAGGNCRSQQWTEFFAPPENASRCPALPVQRIGGRIEIKAEFGSYKWKHNSLRYFSYRGLQSFHSLALSRIKNGNWDDTKG